MLIIYVSGGVIIVICYRFWRLFASKKEHGTDDKNEEIIFGHGILFIYLFIC